MNDEATVDFVVQNLEIIGEAADGIPEAFTARHPWIEWRRIVGLRHRIVHDYFGLDLEIIWVILQQEPPALHAKTSALPIDDEAGDQGWARV